MAATLWDLRSGMRTQAAGISGGGYTLNTSRTVLGYDDFANNADFFASLAGTGSATAGPFLIIKPGDLTDWDFQAQRGTYEIPCDLWLGITRETDDTFQNVEGLLNSLKVAWEDKGITWSLDRPLDLNKNPIPVHYVVTVTTPGC